MARVAARRVVIAFAATLVVGLLLLAFFEPDVQQDDAAELLARRDDARAFLIADFFFIALYAVVSPLAQRRFIDALGDRAAGWMVLAPVLLALGGAFDALENVLLLFATGELREGTVDTAHAIAIPKVIFFIAGALVSLALLVRAVRTLRASPEPAG
jgi:hypothetical protein